MKERPISFKGDFINAILDGRKTQTRRIVKDNPKIRRPDYRKYCPYGLRGDRLWIKETWAWYGLEKSHAHACWRATPESMTGGSWSGIKWKSPRYMPRWASRITLEITGVHVEKIQDITEEDARAEGIDEDSEQCGLCQNILDNFGVVEEASHGIERSSPVINEFKNLWDSIHQKNGFEWEKNPVVWCIEFRCVQPISN